MSKEGKSDKEYGATGPSIRGVTTREVAAHRYSIDLSKMMYLCPAFMEIVCVP